VVEIHAAAQSATDLNWPCMEPTLTSRDHNQVDKTAHNVQLKPELYMEKLKTCNGYSGQGYKVTVLKVRK